MAEEYKRYHCFPLRLSPTMRQQATDLAEREGISLNHFISLAVAEKITRLERAQGDGPKAYASRKGDSSDAESMDPENV